MARRWHLCVLVLAALLALAVPSIAQDATAATSAAFGRRKAPPKPPPLPPAPPAPKWFNRLTNRTVKCYFIPQYNFIALKLLQSAQYHEYPGKMDLGTYRGYLGNNQILYEAAKPTRFVPCDTNPSLTVTFECARAPARLECTGSVQTCRLTATYRTPLACPPGHKFPPYPPPLPSPPAFAPAPAWLAQLNGTSKLCRDENLGGVVQVAFLTYAYYANNFQLQFKLGPYLGYRGDNVLVFGGFKGGYVECNQAAYLYVTLACGANNTLACNTNPQQQNIFDGCSLYTTFTTPLACGR